MEPKTHIEQGRIDIVCSNCDERAVFISPVVMYGIRLVPDIKGTIRCASCGVIKDLQFEPSMYWFKVAVEDRFLYARTRDHAQNLLDFFQSGKKTTDGPEADFPAVFYRNRVRIIAGLNDLLDRHDSSHNP